MIEKMSKVLVSFDSGREGIKEEQCIFKVDKGNKMVD